MATTLVYDFRTKTASLDADKVAEIYEAYVTTQGDEDKADSPEDAAWYEGQKAAYLHVLNLLHDTTSEQMDQEGLRIHPWDTETKQIVAGQGTVSP